MCYSWQTEHLSVVVGRYLTTLAVVVAMTLLASLYGLLLRLVLPTDVGFRFLSAILGSTPAALATLIAASLVLPGPAAPPNSSPVNQMTSVYGARSSGLGS